MLRLYAASVCSTLTHGSVAWMLTRRALATLNGFNYRQLHRITGRSYREEATKPSYDLPTAVRTRRHHWLGHILRIPAHLLERRAVLALGQRAGPPYQPSSLLMDTPSLKRTSSASRRPPRMGTRWPIPMGWNSNNHYQHDCADRCEGITDIYWTGKLPWQVYPSPSHSVSATQRFVQDERSLRLGTRTRCSMIFKLAEGYLLN